jgi:hypothetical protein
MPKMILMSWICALSTARKSWREGKSVLLLIETLVELKVWCNFFVMFAAIVVYPIACGFVSVC